MGIFERLRRPPASSKAPAIESTRSALDARLARAGAGVAAEARQGPKKPFGETPLQHKRIEANEAPRVIRCPQYAFGKKVEHPGGPIQGGSFEHTRMGQTPGLSQAQISKISQPDKLFNDRFDPRSNPEWWHCQGQILKETVEVDGKQFVLCAYTRERSERGEGQPGRTYSEMRTILIPAEEWSVAMVPQLAKQLWPEPMTEKDFNMQTIDFKTDILDKPLPENWFNQETQDLIIKMIQGKTIGLQTGVPESEFLNVLFYALICLPESIARHVSFGAGLIQNRENQLRVSQVRGAHNEVRKLGREWRGVDPQKEAIGQAYVNQLKLSIPNCRTPRDVMKIVGKMDPTTENFFKQQMVI